MTLRNLFVSAIVIGALGCSASKPGEESYNGLGGTLSKVVEASLTDCYVATMEGMRALSLDPTEWERDGFKVLIIGETVMGRLSQTHEVRVWLTRATEGTTKIELRILGRRNEDRLQQILQAIESRLPKAKKQEAAPAQAPAAK